MPHVSVRIRSPGDPPTSAISTSLLVLIPSTPPPSPTFFSSPLPFFFLLPSSNLLTPLHSIGYQTSAFLTLGSFVSTTKDQPLILLVRCPSFCPAPLLPHARKEVAWSSNFVLVNKILTTSLRFHFSSQFVFIEQTARWFSPLFSVSPVWARTVTSRRLPKLVSTTITTDCPPCQFANLITNNRLGWQDLSG